MFFADSPIGIPIDDRLDRSTFASQLARMIDQFPSADNSFVIGLRGEWGSGKTSLVEMALIHLRHLEIQRSAFFRNEFSTNHLESEDFSTLMEMSRCYHAARHFVSDLLEMDLNIYSWNKLSRRNELCRAFGDVDGGLADDYVRLLYSLKLNPQTIVVRFTPWMISHRSELALALLSEIARTLGRSSDLARQEIGALLTRLNELSKLGEAGASAIGLPSSVVSAAGGLLGDIGKRALQGPTLEEARQRANQALRSLRGQRLLVIIDDLDRLEGRELVEILSLVKSICSFPNTIYLLSYDEARISSQIGLSLNVDGRSYLEKIVQHTVDIPIPNTALLRRLFYTHIEGFFTSLSSSDIRLIDNLWYRILSKYLVTPRDVVRFCTSLIISKSSINSDINDTDFLIITILRMFEPDLYSWIIQNLSTLT